MPMSFSLSQLLSWLRTLVMQKSLRNQNSLYSILFTAFWGEFLCFVLFHIHFSSSVKQYEACTLFWTHSIFGALFPCGTLEFPFILINTFSSYFYHDLSSFCRWFHLSWSPSFSKHIFAIDTYVNVLNRYWNCCSFNSGAQTESDLSLHKYFLARQWLLFESRLSRSLWAVRRLWHSYWLLIHLYCQCGKRLITPALRESGFLNWCLKYSWTFQTDIWNISAPSLCSVENGEISGPW